MEQKVANRLSYSQIRLYNECGMKYKYHYVDGYREKTKSGALLFGSAVDKTFENVLKNRDINDHDEFDKQWQRGEINGKYYDLPECVLVGYGASDFDYELLQEDDITFLKAKVTELCPHYNNACYKKKDEEKAEVPTLEQVYEMLADLKKQNDNHIRPWEEAELRLHNLFNWLCMRRKGHLMCDANRKEILPKIKQVLGLQKTGELKNEESDVVRSFLDVECIWDDGSPDGVHVILDYKTAGQEYDPDSVETSPQLTIYCYTHGVQTAGFVVFLKQIKKNRKKTCVDCGHDGIKDTGRLTTARTCDKTLNNGKRCGGAWKETITPECKVQTIIKPIPERTTEIVMENVESTNISITNKIFNRNFNACKQGYGRCAFFDLCFKNRTDNLEKVS